MRHLTRLRMAAALVLPMLVAVVPAVFAQPPDQTAGVAASNASFLALDLFGGAHTQGSTQSGPNRPAGTFGWDIGSTVRFDRRFGVAVGVGRVRTPERAWITHVQLGPRVFHTLGSLTDLRAFAHVLVGRAVSEQPSGARDRSLELMAGGGLDVLNVFRFQLDLVRRDLETFPKTSGRFAFGVALPMCFRQCRPEDGFAVGR